MVNDFEKKNSKFAAATLLINLFKYYIAYRNFRIVRSCKCKGNYDLYYIEIKRELETG